MRGNGFVITYDHLEKKKLTTAEEKYTVEFKLYDDDGELYFSGKMMASLYDSGWIMNPLDYTIESYGCTTLKVKNPATGIWETI